jgi:hypothetical protein
MNWFVWKDGRRLGPLSGADLHVLIRAGDVRAGHAVCRDGSNVWAPLGLIPELAACLSVSETPVSERTGPSASEASQLHSGVAAAVTETATSALDEKRSSDAYIWRHWRGELPLPVSYWVNGILLSLLVAALASWLSAAADFPSAPRLWSLLAILLWTVALAGTVWQVVGVWRAAGEHVAAGGAVRWALAARIAVVLGAIQLLLLLVTQALPQMTEYGKVIVGRDPINGYQIRVLRDGSELEISGYIAFGLTDGLRATLDAHPAITLVHLNSDGGRVTEARKLRDLIASRNLSTYTSTRCVSACVIPFLAGLRRLIGPGAKVGFHQYSVAGVTGRQTIVEMEKDKRYFTFRGVSAAFVQRAFQRTGELWYPTPDEMRTAGFITGQAGNDEVALSGVPRNEIDNVEQMLRRDPLYAAIAESEPEVYQQIAAAVKEGFERGQSAAELRTRTIPLIQQVYRKRLPFASDEAVVAFVRLLLDQMAVLNRTDPEKCRAFLFPDANATVDFRPELGPDLLQREMAVMEQVIRSAASGEWRPPGEAEVGPMRAEVFRQLALSWPTEDLDQLAHLDRRGADAARVCRVCGGLYRAIADLPSEKAGPMFRSLFAADR